MRFMVGAAVGAVVGAAATVGVMLWASKEESGTLVELRDAGRRQHG
jgi:hypothetical protein